MIKQVEPQSETGSYYDIEVSDDIYELIKSFEHRTVKDEGEKQEKKDEVNMSVTQYNLSSEINEMIKSGEKKLNKKETDIEDRKTTLIVNKNFVSEQEKLHLLENLKKMNLTKNYIESKSEGEENMNSFRRHSYCISKTDKIKNEKKSEIVKRGATFLKKASNHTNAKLKFKNGCISNELKEEEKKTKKSSTIESFSKEKKCVLVKREALTNETKESTTVAQTSIDRKIEKSTTMNKNTDTNKEKEKEKEKEKGRNRDKLVHGKLFYEKNNRTYFRVNNDKNGKKQIGTLKNKATAVEANGTFKTKEMQQSSYNLPKEKKSKNVSTHNSFISLNNYQKNEYKRPVLNKLYPFREKTENCKVVNVVKAGDGTGGNEIKEGKDVEDESGYRQKEETKSTWKVKEKCNIEKKENNLWKAKEKCNIEKKGNNRTVAETKCITAVTKKSEIKKKNNNGIRHMIKCNNKNINTNLILVKRKNEGYDTPDKIPSSNILNSISMNTSFTNSVKMTLSSSSNTISSVSSDERSEKEKSVENKKIKYNILKNECENNTDNKSATISNHVQSKSFTNFVTSKPIIKLRNQQKKRNDQSSTISSICISDNVQNNKEKADASIPIFHIKESKKEKPEKKKKNEKKNENENKNENETEGKNAMEKKDIPKRKKKTTRNNETEKNGINEKDERSKKKENIRQDIYIQKNGKLYNMTKCQQILKKLKRKIIQVLNKITMEHNLDLPRYFNTKKYFIKFLKRLKQFLKTKIDEIKRFQTMEKQNSIYELFLSNKSNIILLKKYLKNKKILAKYMKQNIQSKRTAQSSPTNATVFTTKSKIETKDEAIPREKHNASDNNNEKLEGIEITEGLEMTKMKNNDLKNIIDINENANKNKSEKNYLVKIVFPPRRKSTKLSTKPTTSSISHINSLKEKKETNIQNKVSTLKKLENKEKHHHINSTEVKKVKEKENEMKEKKEMEMEKKKEMEMEEKIEKKKEKKKEMEMEEKMEEKMEMEKEEKMEMEAMEEVVKSEKFRNVSKEKDTHNKRTKVMHMETFRTSKENKKRLINKSKIHQHEEIKENSELIPFTSDIEKREKQIKEESTTEEPIKERIMEANIKVKISEDKKLNWFNDIVKETIKTENKDFENTKITENEKNSKEDTKAKIMAVREEKIRTAVVIKEKTEVKEETEALRNPNKDSNKDLNKNLNQNRTTLKIIEEEKAKENESSDIANNLTYRKTYNAAKGKQQNSVYILNNEPVMFMQESNYGRRHFYKNMKNDENEENRNCVNIDATKYCNIEYMKSNFSIPQLKDEDNLHISSNFQPNINYPYDFNRMNEDSIVKQKHNYNYNYNYNSDISRNFENNVYSGQGQPSYDSYVLELELDLELNKRYASYRDRIAQIDNGNYVKNRNPISYKAPSETPYHIPYMSSYPMQNLCEQDFSNENESIDYQKNKQNDQHLNFECSLNRRVKKIKNRRKFVCNTEYAYQPNETYTSKWKSLRNICNNDGFRFISNSHLNINRDIFSKIKAGISRNYNYAIYFLKQQLRKTNLISKRSYAPFLKKKYLTYFRHDSEQLYTKNSRTIKLPVIYAYKHGENMQHLCNQNDHSNMQKYMKTNAHYSHPTDSSREDCFYPRKLLHVQNIPRIERIAKKTSAPFKRRIRKIA